MCFNVIYFNVERITKPGECPVNTRPDQMCAAFVRPGYFNCVHDGRCPGNQKCCRQGCYLGCVESGKHIKIILYCKVNHVYKK